MYEEVTKCSCIGYLFWLDMSYEITLIPDLLPFC